MAGRLGTTTREVERKSAELLKDTPWRSETPNAERAREERHRALDKTDQPYMVCVFGLLDYGVLWVGPDGGADATSDADRERAARREMRWWQERIREGMHMSPFTRSPMEGDIQVRQQWDLDELTAAIRESYR